MRKSLIILLFLGIFSNINSQDLCDVKLNAEIKSDIETAIVFKHIFDDVKHYTNVESRRLIIQPFFNSDLINGDCNWIFRYERMQNLVYPDSNYCLYMVTLLHGQPVCNGKVSYIGHDKIIVAVDYENENILYLFGNAFLNSILTEFDKNDMNSMKDFFNIRMYPYNVKGVRKVRKSTYVLTVGGEKHTESFRIKLDPDSPSEFVIISSSLPSGH